LVLVDFLSVNLVSVIPFSLELVAFTGAAGLGGVLSFLFGSPKGSGLIKEKGSSSKEEEKGGGSSQSSGFSLEFLKRTE